MSVGDLAFMDVESSGLHEGSYPIEFGWAAADADLSSSSFLVRPAPAWGEDLWDIGGEIIHGIPRRKCVEEGMPVRLASRKLNRVFYGKRVLSDNKEFDTYWTARLFEEAGERMEFAIEAFQDVLYDRSMILTDGNVRGALAMAGKAIALTRRLYPHSHRAAPDAIGMAAAHRYLSDAQFKDEVDRRLQARQELELFDFEGAASD